MKKLTVLLTVLIILSNIYTCSFAYELTEDERSANAFVSEFFKKKSSNVYLKTNFDLSEYTIAYFDDKPQIKNEILEKAKEYEEEIRNNHFYRYHEDNIYIQEKLAEECDENGNCPPPDPEAHKIRWPAKQYDSTPIEDVITSFPDYIEKKVSFDKSTHSYRPRSNVTYGLPRSVTISESGFTYICYGSSYVLLYKYRTSEDDKWILCDISTFYDEYDAKYRFHSEDLDVDKLILERGYTPLSQSIDNGTELADESDNEAQNPPKQSKPIDYIPWVICGIEAVAIIALGVVLVIKKKK